MELVNLVQGTPEWHAHRVKYFNASEAPAMLGVSHYKTRAALLRERQTGVYPEVPPSVAARFAEGHRAEALAREWVETTLLCDDLYPVVGVKGKLSASFDGLTLDESIGFEHKITNQRLRDALPLEGENPSDKLPEEYRAQMEQQLWVSGAQKIIFMASSWDEEGRCLEKRYCWYTSDPAMRQRILSGWEEFERDLAAPQPDGSTNAAPVKSDVLDTLPAPLVVLTGDVSVAGNLDAFGAALRKFVAGLPEKPETDQDFVDCQAGIKILKKVEEALDTAVDEGITRIESIALMRRAAEELRAVAQSTRKRLEACVNDEKKARRVAFIDDAQQKFDAHLSALSAEFAQEGIALPVPAPDFAAAIKGLCSVDSIENKLSAALLEGKARADAVAARVRSNINTLTTKAGNYPFLFPDRVSLLCGAEDALDAAIGERVAAYEQHLDSVLKERVTAAVADARREWEASHASSAANTSEQPAEEKTAEPTDGAAIQPALAEKPIEKVLDLLPLQDDAVVSLNMLNDYIAPFTVTRPLLAGFGVEPDAIRNRAAHYRPSQASAVCKLMGAHFDRAARRIADAHAQGSEA